MRKFDTGLGYLTPLQISEAAAAVTNAKSNSKIDKIYHFGGKPQTAQI